jgi:hypothetical protein
MVTREGYRGPFNESSQQAVAEVVVKAAQSVDVYGPVVDPAKRPQAQIGHLVHVCESIVHRFHGSSSALLA